MIAGIGDDIICKRTIRRASHAYGFHSFSILNFFFVSLVGSSFSVKPSGWENIWILFWLYVGKFHNVLWPLFCLCLFRILYGRMLRNTGMSTSGKQGSSLRRGVVLRFLAGCPGEEMKTFVQLISAPFQTCVIEGNASVFILFLFLSPLIWTI